MRHTDERGATALLVAGALLFIFGAAALAVDVSSFYQDATVGQTNADMTCLAGAAELPDTGAAITAAAEIAQLNWPEKSLGAPSVSGSVGIMTDGAGNVVTINASHNGASDQMSVTVSEQAATEFGRVLGADSVTIVQEAVCAFEENLGSSILPFGAVPSWDGVLQTKNPCDTGNCRALDIPRDDSTGSGTVFIRNVALGAQKQLVPHKPALSPPYPSGVFVCTASTPQCTILDQNQGVSTGQLSDGMIRESNSAGVTGRLQDTSSDTAPPLTTKKGRQLDDDGLAQILGSYSSTAPGTPPPSWDSDVHGAFPGAWGGNHVYVSNSIAKCNSPRLVKVPIIAQLDWEPGEAINLPGGNSDPVKVVGFYDAIILDPNDKSDLNNSDSIKTSSVAILWTANGVTCDDRGGDPFQSGVTQGTSTIKLIAG